ncbi:hypothetical protein ACOWPH_08460 [Anabaena sp. PCC 7938]|uniref:Uncharacterized protein n=1 Tax=Anabaena cylindrica (strain ATCC 27899 / PCC 7122) TaxID=272123 RepID=K9ZHU7_ANACC|nr:MULTISPECIES: hypothetical protein [Anabaena]AFZ58329.1 hypothetical protein Anacy_2905 [Anabaena cylindrica PCC 7122]BAY04688.1 hypothetical protein NIES19_39530 [Anabaena cylindrica PCC 7122]
MPYQTFRILNPYIFIVINTHPLVKPFDRRYLSFIDVFTTLFVAINKEFKVSLSQLLVIVFLNYPVTNLEMNHRNYNVDKNEIASLGASLRAIEPKLLKPCQQENTVKIWLQGGEPYFDIFLELKNEQIIWFQFTLRGKSLSWHIDNTKLQTGITNELSVDDVNFYAASKTINNDDVSDIEFINIVKSILQTRADEEIFAKALTLFTFTNNQ